MQQMAVMDIPIAKLEELMRLKARAASLDALVGSGEDTALLDLLPTTLATDDLASAEVELLMERAIAST
jgi:DNA-directed RNA polymerase sigma subunit (sigma70/sigma32)